MTIDDVMIRKAIASDEEIIVQCNMDMASETEDRQLDRELLSHGVRAVLGDPKKGFYLVAETEGKVIGSLLITFEWSVVHAKSIMWFQSVFVCKPYRRLGVFRKLYESVRDMMYKNDVANVLRLYVEHTNTRAQSTYSALGMHESSKLVYQEEL